MITKIIHFLEPFMLLAVLICAIWILATWFALAYHNHKHRNE